MNVVACIRLAVTLLSAIAMCWFCMVICLQLSNQTTTGLESGLNQLRMVTLLYKSGLGFIFNVQEVPLK